jgi:prevent-host-death family protein
MPLSVTKAKLKPQLLKYLRDVQNTGQELIITDRGKPVLKVVPLRQNPEEALRWFRGRLTKYVDPLAPVGLDDWQDLE